MLARARDEPTAQGASVLALGHALRRAQRPSKCRRWPMPRWHEFGAVHLLFNNAGVGSGGLVWENTEADWEWVLGVRTSVGRGTRRAHLHQADAGLRAAK